LCLEWFGCSWKTMLWSKVCHHIQGNSLSRNRLLFKQRSGVYVLLRWCLYCFCPDARRFYIDQIKPKRHSFLYLHPYIRNRIVVVSIYYLVDGSFATCCLLVEESIKNQSYQMVFLCLTFFLKESMSNLYTLAVLEDAFRQGRSWAWCCSTSLVVALQWACIKLEGIKYKNSR
jgi:hypothetical protein